MMGAKEEQKQHSCKKRGVRNSKATLVRSRFSGSSLPLGNGMVCVELVYNFKAVWSDG